MLMVHSILTLAMQSGPFLHLIVTLTTLIARLARFSSSLCRILSTVHPKCLRLLDDLHVRNEQPVTSTYTHNRVS